MHALIRADRARSAPNRRRRAAVDALVPGLSGGNTGHPARVGADAEPPRAATASATARPFTTGSLPGKGARRAPAAQTLFRQTLLHSGDACLFAVRPREPGGVQLLPALRNGARPACAGAQEARDSPLLRPLGLDRDGRAPGRRVRARTDVPLLPRDARRDRVPRRHGREVRRRRRDGGLRGAARPTKTTRCVHAGRPSRCGRASTS